MAVPFHLTVAYRGAEKAYAMREEIQRQAERKAEMERKRAEARAKALEAQRRAAGPVYQPLAPVGQVPQQQQAAAAPEAKGLEPAVVSQMIMDIAASAIGTSEGLDMDTPMMEAGLDSLSMVSFRNDLAKQVGFNLPASLMFDFPSQRAVVDFVVEKSRDRAS
mmetsp:Transcript_34841/g.75999  ORF Transcript_34841/g.75999 Transcript_34841/m.75999 type:complete len:163 (+) Transcript_34841:58-546(+)